MRNHEDVKASGVCMELGFPFCQFDIRFMPFECFAAKYELIFIYVDIWNNI